MEEPEKKDISQDNSNEKKRRPIRFRTVIGILIMIAGLGVCLYPVLRQKQSNDFNQDAINMILTPQPTPIQETEVTKEPVATQVADSITSAPQPTGDEEPATPEITPVEEVEVTPEGEPTPTDMPNRLNNRTVLGVIQIEAIDLIYAIVEGTDTEDIGVAIGHMTGTADLGAMGNCALAGHRGGYSGPYFKNLDKLKIGDTVLITNAERTQFTYKVTESFVVEPTEVWVAEDTGPDKAILTLVTCEDSGSTRLIVRCELESSSEQ